MTGECLEEYVLPSWLNLPLARPRRPMKTTFVPQTRPPRESPCDHMIRSVVCKHIVAALLEAA
jgi:hypothetical protein